MILPDTKIDLQSKIWKCGSSFQGARLMRERTRVAERKAAPRQSQVEVWRGHSRAFHWGGLGGFARTEHS